MKQGRAPTKRCVGDEYVRPYATAIDPGYPAGLGEMVGPARAVVTMGRKTGFMGPKADTYAAGPGGGRTVHHCGSQGKHR